MTTERRGWREHPLVQLTLVRYREFFREPEAVFWVFVFPVLLTAGLGLAFRNQAPERTRVAIVEGEGARAVSETLSRSREIEPEVLADTAAAQALRTGRVEILVIPRPGATVEYRFDPERPESRTARLLVDDALQRGAGRRDAVSVEDRRVSEPGSRYVDFVVPGLLGMNLMGSGIWGLGFSIVDARRKKLLKRMIATPMSRTQFLASFVLSRLTMLIIEVGALVGFAVLVFGVPVRGSPFSLLAICLLSALAFGACAADEKTSDVPVVARRVYSARARGFDGAQLSEPEKHSGGGGVVSRVVGQLSTEAHRSAVRLREAAL